MKVLSLFDGISCGRIALERANIPVSAYYASEIDKHCITIAQYHYPDTIQLGDVTKWRDWDIDWQSIDILFAGFPCQAWSSSGNLKGIEDPRGALFLVLLEILGHLKKNNPKLIYLFENVIMKKAHKEYIDNLIGHPSVVINSALVSGQNRNRQYWCNSNITQPEDKNILLKDILEHGVTDKLKSFCIDACYYKGGNLRQYFEKSRRQLVFSDEVALAASMVGRRTDANGIRHDYDKSIPKVQRIEIRDNPEKTGTLTTVQKDNILLYKGGWRNLTPLETERLQTLPENYTNVAGIAKSHRYKAIGNGWTVDVIAHILRGIK